MHPEVEPEHLRREVPPLRDDRPVALRSRSGQPPPAQRVASAVVGEILGDAPTRVVLDALDQGLVLLALVAHLDHEVDAASLVLHHPGVGFDARITVQHGQHVGDDQRLARVEHRELARDEHRSARATKMSFEVCARPHLAAKVAHALGHGLLVLGDRREDPVDHVFALGGREARPGLLVGKDHAGIVPDAHRQGRRRDRHRANDTAASERHQLSA